MNINLIMLYFLIIHVYNKEKNIIISVYLEIKTWLKYNRIKNKLLDKY